MYKNWVDNRDLRDKKYLGPLVVPYDETNPKHVMYGLQSFSFALEKMIKILYLDLDNLKNKKQSIINHLNEKKKTNEKLIFTNFYDGKFTYIMRGLIESGKYRFKLKGDSSILTTKTLSQLQKKQDYDIRNYLSAFDPIYHVGIMEMEFETIYNQYKKKIGWFWDKPSTGSFKYKTVELISEAINNCEKKIIEGSKMKNGEIV